MRTREQQIKIANTIIMQLGGSRFRGMTGAKDFFATDAGLSFKLPGTMTKNRINYIEINLDPSDTYNMKFKNIRGMKVKTVSEFSMVYDDMLQDVFKSETGFDTHL